MKKKNIQTSVRKFKEAIEKIEGFLKRAEDPSVSEMDRTWAYEYAIIRLYRDFEWFIFSALVTAINNDTAATLSKVKVIKFPKHLTDEVCECLIVGDRRYFGFNGKGGLVDQLANYLPIEHQLLKAVKKHGNFLDEMSAVRNFAAHNSPHSKKMAIKATGTNSKSAGMWLQHKSEKRFEKFTNNLKKLANKIERSFAPDSESSRAQPRR